MKDRLGNEHDESNGQFTSNGATAAEVKRTDVITGAAPTESIADLKEQERKKPVISKADKIASVHIERGKDNILPELNEEDLEKIGAKQNKPVLVKADIIERNKAFHSDIGEEEGNKIIGEALYSPAKIFNGNKDNYFIFAQVVRFSSKTGEPRFGTVLLDVNETLNNFEVVHWHVMVPKELERAEKKNK